jgi:hypothetical protein
MYGRLSGLIFFDYAVTRAQLTVQLTALVVQRLFYFDEFFELMLHFLHHVVGSVKQQYRYTSFKIIFILVRNQFLDPHPSAIQNVYDPVDHRKVIV